MAEDIKLEGNVFPLLRVGDEVGTPDGDATVHEIAIHGGSYGDRVELEPPAIFVKMKDEANIPAVRQVCMCVLNLADTVHEKLLSKEMDRLWPPIDEGIPEEAYMLVDPDKGDVMRSVRTSDRRTAESDEARELKLYLDNDRELYERLMRDYYGNLVKKLAAGRYNRALSPKLFMYFVEVAARSYCRDHCSSEREWSQVFDKATRMEVAEELADDFEADIRESGDMEFITKHIPKKYRGVDLAEMLDKTAAVHTAGSLSPDQEDLADEWGLEDDTAVAVFEMLEEEDLPVEDADVKEGIWGWREAADMAWVEVGSREYGVSPSWEDAEELAVVLFRDQVEDDPNTYLTGNSFFQGFVDEEKLRRFLWDDEYNNHYDRLLDEAESDVEEAVEELERWDFDTDAAYGTDDELDEATAKDLVEALADDYAEKVTKEQLEDPMLFLEDIYSKEEVGEQLVKWGMIDIDAAVKEAIRIDGPGHFLSGYDGGLYELTSGGVYWRHN
jgi:hypothetical protein